jgi:hypothetical protein
MLTIMHSDDLKLAVELTQQCYLGDKSTSRLLSLLVGLYDNFNEIKALKQL